MHEEDDLKDDELEEDDELEDDEDDLDDDDEDEEGDEEDDDDAPTSVFVGMALRRDNSDALFNTIKRVCADVGLTAFRAEQQHLSGRMPPHQVVQMLVDDANFAILDVTYDRPTLVHEITICDREFAPEFVLQIAKDAAPLPPITEGRTITTYRDPEELRMIVRRQLNQMIDAWNEGE